MPDAASPATPAPAPSSRSAAAPSAAERGARLGWLGRKLAISLGSLGVFLVLGEIACRLAGYAPVSTEEMLVVGDADYQYKPAPDQDTWHIHQKNRDPHPVRVHINAYGQRSPDYPLAKPAGEVRILGIGDSLMFGPGVEDSETFMAQLEQGYELSPSGPGRVRTANAGMNGYATVHYRDFARTQLERFRPDVFVVALFTGNDMVLVPNSKAVVPVPWHKLTRWSALAVAWDELYREVLWKALTKAKRDKSWEDVQKELDAYRGKQPADMTPEEKRRLWEHSLGHVADIVAAAEAADVEPVVLLLPIAAQTTVAESIDPTYDWLRAEIEARGMPVIDALPYLRVGGLENWLAYDVGHLSPAGHRQVARALMTGLRELGLVR